MNIIKDARRIVLKIGSSTLTHENFRMNLRRIEALTRVLSDFKNAGKEIVLVSSGAITLGDEIDVCVPTGNFGNIFAGYIAKLMGLPIKNLVCASNANNVLTDFLKNGEYNKNRDFHATMSPSMDILISSNLERLLYTVIGTKSAAEYMQLLNSDGKYALSPDEFAKISECFYGYYTDECGTAQTIKNTYEKANCLIDTHTAVAVSAAERYMRDHKAERRMLVVSTASPYKFAKDVYASLTGKAPSGDIEALAELCELTSVPVPAPLSGIGERKVIHDRVIDKSDMASAVKDFAL